MNLFLTMKLFLLFYLFHLSKLVNDLKPISNLYIYDLRITINLAEPFKSSVLAQQTLGRCRADNTLYIDVVDQGFYFTKKYYQAKKPVFGRYAKSCKSIMMSDQELDSRCDEIHNRNGTNKIMCMKIYKE